MKLVKEHINEKFVEDSDPIQDMGIGIIKLFKNAPLYIFRKDEKDLIYTIEITNESITFYVHAMSIILKFNEKPSHLSSNTIEYFKKYCLNIVKKVGFYPNIISDMKTNKSTKELPGFNGVNFTISLKYENIAPNGKWVKKYITDDYNNRIRIWDKKNIRQKD